MPIHHMLYRCPRCGHDPLEGHKGRAKCSSCGTLFEQGRGSVIIVRPPDGLPEQPTTSRLLADLEKMGGPGISKDLGKDRAEQLGVDLDEGSLFRESRISLGRAEGHDVIRWRGEALGFSERISWKGVGLLKLEGDALTFGPGRDPAGLVGRNGRTEPPGEAYGFSCLLSDIGGFRLALRPCKSRSRGRACINSSPLMTP